MRKTCTLPPSPIYNMLMNILVTKGWYEAPDHIEEIMAMGYTVYYIEHEDDPLPCDPAIINGVVCCKVFNYHPIEEFTNLRFIQVESVGYDRVPLDYAKAHDIMVYNVGATYAGPMSEYIICQLLDWYRNTNQELVNRINKGWDKNFNKQELSGRTVCIIGTGNIAKYTAKKLKGFDCKVLAISHTARDIAYIDEVRSYSILHETLAESDIVIIATPPDKVLSDSLADEESGSGFMPVIGARELAAMKRSALLVNVARGTQVDEPALIEALQNGTIRGAILDVFQEEPLPEDSPLWNCKNAILTPHSSYIGEGNADRLWNTIKTNLLLEKGL